jgi:hypothetical protein
MHKSVYLQAYNCRLQYISIAFYTTDTGTRQSTYSTAATVYSTHAKLSTALLKAICKAVYPHAYNCRPQYT